MQAGSATEQPNYGVDAPAVLRNLFLIGLLLWLLVFLTPARLQVGHVVILWHNTLEWTGSILLLEALLFLLYVKWGKFRHRDLMLSLHAWQGSEQVLDVGCGRGLLLAGAAKLLNDDGGASGIDIWSNVDMGGNSEAATRHNLTLEGIEQRCTLVSGKAQQMPFPGERFDVVLSNLCLHNISAFEQRAQALSEIDRVLRPGGVALLSDYKHTGQYASHLRKLGFAVERRWGNPISTFPPLRVVVARKPPRS